MVRPQMLAAVPLLVLLPYATAGAQTHHTAAPLKDIPSEQWVEVVSGDPAKPGAPFVIRIHNDPGFVCPPHTHPTDENIVVVKGTWSVGMGSRIDPAGLQRLAVGDFVLVPQRMAHFCRSETETIIQVHGLGPFSIDMVDPLYELSADGVSLMTSFGGEQKPVATPPGGCFTLALGDRVRSNRGEGRVVGAYCTSAIGFTQYWVQQDDGGRFWATADELTKR